MTSRVLEKKEYFNEKLPDRVLQAGTWARTECHGGRPCFLSHNENKTKNNVTDVLVGLGIRRDRFGRW